MSIKNLSKEEIKIVNECIRASAYGPFFIDNSAKDNPHWEIHSIFGLTMDQLRKIADDFANVDLESDDVKLAINNCINNLLYYPHNCPDKIWSSYISVSKRRLSEIFVKWKGKSINSYLEGLE